MTATRIEAAVAELTAAIIEAISADAPAADGPGRLLSIREAQAALGGLSRPSVYALLDISGGPLRSVKAGRRRLVPASSVRAFIEQAAA